MVLRFFSQALIRPARSLMERLSPSKKATVAVAVIVGLAAANSPSLMSDGLAAVGAVDLASVMRDRSPGKRVSGELIKSKRARHADARALPKTRVREARATDASTSPLPPPPLAFLEAPLGPSFGPPIILDEVSLAAVLTPLPDLVSGGGLASFLPPFSGGIPVFLGGGGTSPGVNPPAPPPPTSVVPEPSAWVTLLSGFGAIGLLLRRKRRRRAECAVVGDAAHG
jgi:hypothetical protein